MYMKPAVHAARLKYQTYWMLVIEIALLLIIPITAFKLYPTIFEYRLQILWALVIYFTLIIGWQKITIADLGLETKNFRQALKAIRLPTILMCLPLVLIASFKPELLFINEVVPLIESSLPKAILNYILISVTAQELIFRSVAIARLSLVNKSKKFLLIAASLVFMSAHIPFNNPYFIVGSIVPGIIWTYFYIQNRNVYAIIISHMIVGLAAFIPTLLLLPR